MIPKNNNIDIEIIKYPNHTYKLNSDSSIIGFVDGIDAIKQTIFKILNTERYSYMIYSWNYGFEVEDLIGEPYNYVRLELQDRIISALTQDDRIEKVKNFRFEKFGDKVLVNFEIQSIYGEFESNYLLNT